MDALPAGQYILLGSVQADFNLDQNSLIAQNVYVSNISFVSRDDDYFLLHRETGAPLDGAKMQLWKQVYDEKNRKYKDEKSSVYTADKNGFFESFEKQDRRQQF